MQTHVIIPARFNSSRLPGKPLLEINNKPLIWHVYQRALESSFSSVYVATDDDRIAEAVSKFDGNVLMTSEKHVSGTDRLAEAIQQLNVPDSDIVINLQGDEPLVPSKYLTLLAESLNRNPDFDIATLCCEIEDLDSIFNPNVVKVAMTAEQKAMFFSRAPIPWNRELFSFEKGSISSKQVESSSYLRHIGLYAYRAKTLNVLSQLPPSTYEKLEALEQMRALESGMNILVNKVKDMPPHGVDTMEDYMKIKQVMEAK